MLLRGLNNMEKLRIKEIHSKKDIEELREDEVVRIPPFASYARYGGIRDSMSIFSYRTGDHICELWVERIDINPSSNYKNAGAIEINPRGGPYEPIIYRSSDNTHLFKTKNEELRRVNL